jgi:hypothetical protein
MNAHEQQSPASAQHTPLRLASMNDCHHHPRKSFAENRSSQDWWE